MTKTIIPVFIYVLMQFSVLHSQAYIIPDLERDDFTSKKDWWIFQVHGSQSEPTTHNGYLLIQLLDPLNGNPGGPLDPEWSEGENTGIMTADQRPIYSRRDTMEATIRVKTLNNLPPGSRGWGFWKSEPLAVINQAVWFMEQKADSDSVWFNEETWWRARTTNGIKPGYHISTDLDTLPFLFDNQQWHTYKVIRNSRYSYEHYIDGQFIQRVEATDFPDSSFLNEDYSFNCWNDNLVYHYTTTADTVNPDTVEGYTNGWLGVSEMVVDFVEIRHNGYKPGYSVAPSGIVALRQIIDEVDDGISDGLWKGPYSFTTPGGPCLILATAKAEQYGAFDNADNLKIVLDSTDFGYHTSRSWDGLTDNAMPKTVIIDTALDAGQHTVAVHSQVTPILYDVTVLASANGEVAYNVQLNESAPDSSINFLWKKFVFHCDSGLVAVYISGSADEEPGWNHQNSTIDSTDDDELRVMIDNKDFGWGTDSSFVGNSMFGDSKTLLLIDTLSSGRHSLSLYTNESPTVYNVVIFSENKADPSLISADSFTPARFEVEQNYPNPFNPRTTIVFNLPQRQDASVKIYDIRGTLVRVQEFSGLAAGTHKYTWDGKNEAKNPVASGIYFYRVTAGKNSLVRKMTLLR